jgi:arylsulfatase A-like enzyme
MMPGAKKKTNVIWVFGDQMRAQAMSCNGDPNINTPNLDLLAANGVNVRGAVSGFPLCCPYRGALLTSTYPHRCVPGHEKPLDPATPTVAHAFKENGYHTAYFGKWHLDGFEERNGRSALHKVEAGRRGGFDIWQGYDNNNSQMDCWIHGHDRNGTEVPHYRLPGFETDCLTDLLINYITEQAAASDSTEQQPFFACLSVQPPHDPYTAPPEYMRRYNPNTLTMRDNVPAIPRIQEQARRELAGYYALIDNLDWNVGRVMEALRETGLLENTHVIFFSDHGDMHGSHGQFKKMTPHEEAIRVPFIISGLRERYVARGGISDAPINHVDVAPTTLGLCGLEVPTWMEGTDFSGLRLRDKPAPADADSAYLQSVIPTGHENSVDKPWRGVVTRDGWKYVCFEGVEWLLFNLNEDPYEQANLAHNSAFREKRRQLNARLRRWIVDTDDRFELPEV